MTQHFSVSQIDWDSDVVYCPDIGEVTTNTIANILSDELFCGELKAYLANIYRNIQIGNLTDRIVSNVFSQNNSAAWVSVFLRKYFEIGHDLPVWMKKRGEENVSKRVMIVSETPLRKMLENMNTNIIVLTLSTPFGIHKPSDPLNNQTVKSLVEKLLSRGALVYMTDSIKLCVGNSNDGNKSKQSRPLIGEKEYDDAYKNIMNFEEQKFNPDVILTLGEVATRHTATGLYRLRFSDCVVPVSYMRQSQHQIIPLIHMSNRVSGMIAKRLAENRIERGNRGIRKFVQEEYYDKVIDKVFKCIDTTAGTGQ